MAEESTNNQVESEKIEPEDGDKKAYPVDRITITKGSPKIASRYLSGPRSSCHDMCKYGIQHVFEAKPCNTARKRVTSTRERKTQVQEENVTSPVGTKKSGSNSKPSPTSKIGNPNSPVDIKEVINEEKVNSEKNSPPFEETDVSTMEHNNSDLRQAQHSEPSPLPVQESSKSQTKRKIVKNKVAFGSSSRKETESSSKQKSRPALTGDKEKSMPTTSPLSSKHKVKKPSSLSAKTSKNLRGVSSLKDHQNVEEVKPELASNDNVPDKIFHVIEPTSTNLSEEPTLPSDETKLPSSSPSLSSNNSLKQTSGKIDNSGVSASSRKGLRRAGHGTRPSVSVSPSSSGSKGKKPLSVSRSTSMSSVSSSNISHGKQHGAATSKSNKTGNGSHGEKVKVGYKVKPRMSTIGGAANKVVAARKLTFRRGKVIELQPQSSNIPRRLKFRPARILDDDNHRDTNAANVKTEKVVSRFQIVEGIKKRSIARKVGGKVDGSKPGSDEKVVLRHPDLEGRKVNPRLYNNVIEETASMLAELRKSKVKALVGAFETVISLDSPREATPAEVSTPC